MSVIWRTKKRAGAVPRKRNINILDPDVFFFSLLIGFLCMCCAEAEKNKCTVAVALKVNFVFLCLLLHYFVLQ